ncbi:MAG TPA: cation:proton antiporter, partial [Candidatus Methylomirabilis sp.]|nr:cation:proton antiporter [Candidatus Methylomirabilis sp.]
MFNLAVLLLQTGVILIAARGIGSIFRRFRQPQVVGEIAAGIMLGPSLLGWLA